MPQFPVTPAREKILERLPDYAVDITTRPGAVVVTCNGKEIARSEQALLVQETRHADVYYLPRTDVNMALFLPTEHSTYCPFKGHASYWTLMIEGHQEQNVVWSYEDPYPEVNGLRDYLSFYTDRPNVKINA